MSDGDATCVWCGEVVNFKVCTNFGCPRLQTTIEQATNSENVARELECDAIVAYLRAKRPYEQYWSEVADDIAKRKHRRK